MSQIKTKRHRKLHWNIVHILVFFLLMGFGSSRRLQPTGAIAHRDSLIQQVSSRAIDDATNKVSRLSPTELEKLFGPQLQNAGLSLPEIDKAYRETYSRTEESLKKAEANKPWYKSISFNSGLIGAGILALLVIIWKKVEELFGKLLSSIGRLVYSKWAGRVFLRRFGMNKYRKSVIKQNVEIKIPFRPNRPLRLRETFVPLRVLGTGDTEQLEAATAICAKPFTVVLGVPGAGKSMLVRSLSLATAETRNSSVSDGTLPVIIELARLNKDTLDLVGAIANVLKEGDFPAGRTFVENGLRHGSFLIFFDGLDEVNAVREKDHPERPTRRDEVADAIVRLRREFEGPCRMIVTCRSAVYDHEFDDIVDQTLEIVEFSDWQIHRFLTSWKGEFPETKSAESLLAALRDRPNIYRLARNPLLLTIIAYLYADTEFVLPHSRAEFYQEAATVLLRILKADRNRFEAPTKRLILRHIALVNQKRASQDHDRRTIDLESILSEISTQLPTLHIPDADPKAILDEIVERSGLIVPVDGGTKYQFAHLTLQEFFAAEELASKEDDLFAFYEQEPGAWREVVLLWCGLDHDSASLISQVSTKDPILALECVAEARQLTRPELADQIIRPFREALGSKDQLEESTMRALALVAADHRPRGRQFFDELARQLPTDRKVAASPMHRSIAKILSFTNRPEAASVLVRSLQFAQELTRMGDVAVPALSQQIARHPDSHSSCIAILRAINTPAAARPIVPLLWSHTSQMQAALALGELLANPEIETDLKGCDLSAEMLSESDLWIWKPFDPAGGPLSRIASRIVIVLLQFSPEQCEALRPLPCIDRRLAVVVSSLICERDANPSESSHIAEFVHKLERGAMSQGAGHEELTVEDKLREEAIMRLPLLRWINGQPFEIRMAWLNTLAYRGMPRGSGFTASNWQSAFSPNPKSGFGWEHKVLSGVLFLLLLVIGIFAKQQLQSSLTWMMGIVLGLLVLVPLGVAVLALICRYENDYSPYAVIIGIFFPICGSILAIALIDQHVVPQWLFVGIAWFPCGLLLMGCYLGGVVLCSRQAIRRLRSRLLEMIPFLLGLLAGTTLTLVLSSLFSQFAIARVGLPNPVVFSAIASIIGATALGIAVACDSYGVAQRIKDASFMILVGFIIISLSSIVIWAYHESLQSWFGVWSFAVISATYFALGLASGLIQRKEESSSNPLRPIAQLISDRVNNSTSIARPISHSTLQACISHVENPL